MGILGVFMHAEYGEGVKQVIVDRSDRKLA